MKLSTPHQQSFPNTMGTHCVQCKVKWPCDAAIACEEVETLNRIIARLLDGWQPYHEEREWSHREMSGDAVPEEPMSDAEVVALRPHLETP